MTIQPRLFRGFCFFVIFGPFGLAMHPACAQNRLSNGSFEDPHGFSTVVGPDTTSIPNWGVFDGQVHITGTGLFASSDGVVSIDLEGLVGAAPAILEQEFPTIAGEILVISFDLAGNPTLAQGLKELEVSLANASAAVSPAPFHTEQYTFDTTGRGPALVDMGWTRQSFTVTATQTGTTWLRFQSQQNTGFGPAIDDVFVGMIPEPTTLTLAAIALLGIGWRRRKRA